MDESPSSEIIYLHVKSCYEEEVTRFQVLDEKLNKLLNFISALVLLYSSLVVWLYTTKDLPQVGQALSLLYVFCFFTGVSLISALSLSLRGARPMVVLKAPAGEAAWKLRVLQTSQAYDELYKTYNTCLNSYRDAMETKTKCINLIYDELATAFVCFCVTLFFFIVIKM